MFTVDKFKKKTETAIAAYKALETGLEGKFPWEKENEKNE